MLQNVPLELRQFPQWVLWRLEESQNAKPTKVPYSAQHHGLASIDTPSDYATFDQCIAALNSYPNLFSGLGFVLTDNDPFTFIDLDDPWQRKPDGTPKYPNPEELFEQQKELFASSQSYAEYSPSGRGLHIIVRGKVPKGKRRGTIECYSNMRYMTVTGNVFRNSPIVEEQPFLDVLFERLNKDTTIQEFYAGDTEQTQSDEQVIEAATNAANGPKFTSLYYDGNFTLQGYESQSEADFALIDIIQFYSKNKAQIKRLFLESALGKRKKSQRTDYINGMIDLAFDMELPPIDLAGLDAQLQASIDAHKVIQRVSASSPITISPAQIDFLPQPSINMPTATDVYTRPPGLVGDIAEFIYQAAPRPVAEIALAGAIGIIAGIAGQSFNISATGLNQYVLLLAPTGTGKEAISSGTNKIKSALCQLVQGAERFFGPAEIASPQALARHLSTTSSCFVSNIGEVGLWLQTLTNPNAMAPQQGLKRILLDLYNKSGHTDSLSPTIYSDAQKNTAAIKSPAFTMVGESTPESYYQNLNESMIASGFLPRFTIIEYHGKRPALNVAHASVAPSVQMMYKLAALATHCLANTSQTKVTNVQMTAEANATFDTFNAYCDLQINSTDAEMRKHLWNRAHIKALKLAAVVAVGGDIVTQPIITNDVATWAINLVVHDVRNLLTRFEMGEIGIDNDETKQLAKVSDAIHHFVVSPIDSVSTYLKGIEHLHGHRVVPIAYLQRKLLPLAVFKNDRRGSTNALHAAVKVLIERGDLAEIARQDMVTLYNCRSRAFKIVSPKAFDL